MPVVSDPGFRLVHLAVRHAIPVVPVPGASAFVAALAASGLPVDKFRFLGFLPSKKAARRRMLEENKSSTKTLVFYEAPHRILEMLRDVRDILGERDVVLAREVTKVHEEFWRGTVSALLERAKGKAIKGEITLLVGGATATGETKPAESPIQSEIQALMAERGVDERAALKAAAKARGISRSQAYRLLQSEKTKQG
jgi:16S rRNA (cytidine1402-2'-O)-methyltransferase